MPNRGVLPAWAWTLILITGILIRLGLPWVVPQTPFQGDGYEYYRYADNLFQHGTYSADFSNPQPGAGRVPGVPFLILPVLHWATAQLPWVTLPVTLCSILSLLLVASLLRNRPEFPNQWKIHALALYALLPIYDLYNGRFYPDVPAGTALLLLIAWLWNAPEKLRSSVLFPLVSGILVAISAYFRPEMVVHIALPLLWSWGQGNIGIINSLRMLTLTAFGLMLGLSPWILRNAVQFGRFIPLDQPYVLEGGTVAPDSSNACASGLYAWMNTWYTRESEIKEVAWDFRHANLDQLPQNAFRNTAEKEMIATLQTDSVYRCGADRILAGIAEQRRNEEPFQYYISLPVQRMCRLLFRMELPSGNLAATSLMWVMIVFQWAVHLSVLFCAVRWRRHALLASGIFLMAYRLVLFSLFHHVEYRYMLSAFPVFFLAAVLVWHRKQQS